MTSSVKNYCVFLLLITTSQIALAQSTTAKIAAGYNQSLVLREDGTVYSFGAGNFGSTGQTFKRIDIPGLAEASVLDGQKIKDVALGKVQSDFALVLLADGRLFGIGNNSNYQIGLPLTQTYTELTEIPNSLFDGHTIVDVETGTNNSLFRTASGLVYVVGANPYGYLGLGNTTNPISTPTQISSMSTKNVVSISAGGEHVFLHTDNSEIWAYGRNSNGDLGLGDAVPRMSPVRIDTASIFTNNGETVIKAIAGYYNSFFLTQSGKVYSSGYKQGALGFPSDVDVLSPQQITHPNLSGKTVIDAIFYGGNSGSRAVLLTSDGSVFTFGEGVLSLGRSHTDNGVPVNITHSTIASKTIVEIAGGFSYYAYLRASDGSIYTFGGYTQLTPSSTKHGEPSSGTGRWNAPELVPTLVDVSQLSGKHVSRMIMARNHSYFVTTDSLLYSFGGAYPNAPLAPPALRNAYPSINSPTLLPASLFGGSKVKSIFAGGKQSYAITESNTVYHFGQNTFGQLGRADSLDHYLPIEMDLSLINNKQIRHIAIDIANNEFVTLIVTTDGSVYAHGTNTYGQLGLGDTLNRATPTLISHANISGKTIVHASTSGYASLLVASDGTVFTFGYNLNGYLGHGTSTNVHVPTAITQATVTSETIVSGEINSETTGNSILLLTSNGKVITFGEGNDGQLGHGDKADNSTPRMIPENLLNKKIIKIQTFDKGSLLLSDDGHVFGLGNAMYVGFNTGTFTDYTSPTLIASANVAGQFIKDIAMKSEHNLILREDGSILSSVGGLPLTYNRGVVGSGDPGLVQKVHVKIPDFTTYQSPIPANHLKLHLNAGRLGYTTSNDSVSVWGDLSSVGANHGTASGSQRPVVVDSAINNQPAIRFTGNPQHIILPTSSTLGIQNNDYELFIAARSATANSDINFLMSGANEHFEIHTNGSSGVRFIPNYGNYIDQGAIGQYTDGNTYLVNVRATDTYANTTINRSNTTQIAINGRSSDGSNLVLGVRQNVGYWLNGDIAEVILYNQVLSSSDRNAVEVYLFNKYGIQNYKNESASLTGTEGWRLLSSPVADSSYASFFRGMWTQGFTGASTSNGASNVYTWSTDSSGANPSNWIPLTNGSAAFPAGNAVLAYIFGDDDGPGNAGNAGFPKTLQIDGFAPTVDVNMTSRLNTNVNGWSLVGNPFTTNVSWNAFSKTNLSGSVYAWDNASSAWKTYNGILGGLTNGHIGPFTGFFVETFAESPSLTIPVSSKVEGESAFFGKSQENKNPFITLEVRNETGRSNQAWISLSEGGQLGKDVLDASKLAPFAADFVQISTSSAEAGIQLDINNLPLTFDEIKIPVEIAGSSSGLHEIHFTMDALPLEWSVSLMDLETGSEFGPNEPVSIVVKSKIRPTDTRKVPEIQTQKAGNARFVLRIKSNLITSTEGRIPTRFELAQNYPNPFNPTTTIQFALPKADFIQLDIYDMNGRNVGKLVSESRSAGYHSVRLDATNLSSGLYLYRLTSSHGVITRKLMVIK